MRLDYPWPNGSTERANLLSVKRQTGKMPAALREPHIPGEARYLVNWFWDLNGSRGHTDSGLLRLPYAEIAAWAGLMGTEPTAWEIQALRAMDDAVVSQARIEAGRRRPQR